MNEIKCPKCGTVFQVDESHYAAIVAQIRSAEFNSELSRRVQDIEREYKLHEESVRLKTEKSYDSRLAEKERTISRLQTELAGKESEHKVSIMEVRSENAAQLQSRDSEILKLRADIESTRLAAKNRENELRELHQLQMRDKQEEIDRLKDFKMRLSTKMVGETLEQHCSILFAQAQSMGLYPNAFFGKDTVAVEGTKGDFIFRDYIDGEEYVSIMFEMKNETDSNSVKHRNDDFLSKLDKDRRRKNCEYAVLVSMLEQGNDLYDGGIVDKSHLFEKMLVIRPQFFMPVLRLITEGARKGFLDGLNLRRELAAARDRSMDFAKFEDKINKFRSTFNKNVTAAHDKFVKATEGIDKTIEALEKQIKALRDIKANFEASEQKLLRANEIADEDLTVKKLTHGNPNIRRMIEEARDEHNG